MMISTTHDALHTCAVQYRNRFHASTRRVLGDPEAARDAVQDAMLYAVRNLSRLRGDSQMSTWLERIVVNQAISRRRTANRRPEQSLEPLLDQADARWYEGTGLARAE